VAGGSRWLTEAPPNLSRPPEGRGISGEKKTGRSLVRDYEKGGATRNYDISPRTETLAWKFVDQGILKRQKEDLRYEQREEVSLNSQEGKVLCFRALRGGMDEEKEGRQ